ncbi:uncharacterized protein BX663DRAFT_454807 [Cokeromyces recurvatus]|uniref:uncharacterized protein n=1 Tax=Cokeromyces recurvatus TaxID=90255 RepID=UPI0022204F9F|nr:uncharacterized protein BX663DRAFT_454807 [Cokeromyces recurvatus]KAI7902707.1 hypothetical protein BX663DRAFT_454807 [Cokeromyces recurvatus]
MSLAKLFKRMSIQTNEQNLTINSIESLSGQHSMNYRTKTYSDCIICMVRFKTSNLYSTQHCDHITCRDCIRNYLFSILKKNRCTSYETIECPSPHCKYYFNTEEILDSCFTNDEIKNWWQEAILKCYILNKIYCPFKECGAVFDADIQYTKTCTFTECYECHRGFCIACQTAWHPGIFFFSPLLYYIIHVSSLFFYSFYLHIGVMKKIDDEKDLQKTLKKAEKSYWTRCPKCGQLIEKMNGCTSMICTCGISFCYRCGSETNSQYSCKNRCERLSSEDLKLFRSPMFDLKKQEKKLKE